MSTSTDLAPTDAALLAEQEAAGYAALEHVLGTGDLARLTNEQRIGHYLRLCRALGLEELSRPFDWLLLDGKLVLYPNKSCAEQLRRAHQISVRVIRREPVGDLFVVEVEGTRPNGQTDQASKYVPTTKWDRQHGQHVRLQGAELANAYAKAETGAKRRLAFSMVGLAAVPDPEELAAGRVVVVDGQGKILESPTVEQKALAADPKMARAIGEPVYEDTRIEESRATQAPRSDELAMPERRSDPRPTFYADVEHCKRRWFAMVKETSLDDDEARARFVTQLTSAWPEGKRTSSLPVMFARCTQSEADDILAHVQAITDDEKRALAGLLPDEDDPEHAASEAF